MTPDDLRRALELQGHFIPDDVYNAAYDEFVRLKTLRLKCSKCDELEELRTILRRAGE